MLYFRAKASPSAQAQNKITIRIIEQNPDDLIGIKTARVYSQIARVSRDPRKKTERVILIKALEQARQEFKLTNKITRKDPPFIVMKARAVEKCFGQQVEKMPRDSFFQASDFK